MIAVAVCTYNPDERLLARTLASIAGQTISADQVECVLVDNNSTPPIETFPAVHDFLKRHPSARVIIERRIGLTSARLAAIASTDSPLVCFVDDDNELAPDYLRTASRLMASHPDIGALGPGHIVVEFVDGAPAWFASEFRHHFQEKDIHGLVYGCEHGTWQDYYPPGSAVIVRREVLRHYASQVAAGALSASDRMGTQLSSGGDLQIVWESIKLRLAAGVSSELRIRHLIPSKRSTLHYIKRLCFGTSSSYLPVLVDSFPEMRQQVQQYERFLSPMAVARMAIGQVVRGRVKLLPAALAAALGTQAGLAKATGARIPRWMSTLIRILRLE